MSDPKRPFWLQNVQFMLSAAAASQFPADTGREIAFVGRSNVGKSSLLNLLTARKQLAKTSKTPGRTRLVNFFRCTDDWRLVDLPGYGFAKVSQTERKAWDRLIAEYLETRQSLAGIVLIMDSRHPLKDTDLHIIEWVAQADVPLFVLLNKSDKLSRTVAKQTLRDVRDQLQAIAGGIHCELVSASKKTNLPAVFNVLQGWVQVE